MHSSQDLDEAVVIVTTKAGVAAARRFIESLCVALVDDDWLVLCEAKWRPPRHVPHRRPVENWSPIPVDSTWRLWVIETSPSAWPGYVEDAVRQHHKGVRARGAGPYKLETLVWEGTPSFRADDVVVERFYPEAGPVVAYPPARVERVWRAQRLRSQRTLITLMRPRGLRPVAVSSLDRAAAQAGWHLRQVRAQQAPGMSHRQAVLTLWPKVFSEARER